MKTKKKMMSLLLAVCMVLTLMPTTALAEESTVDTWDGSADTSWYNRHELDAEYHIMTAEQLAGLAQLVNADPGKTNFAGKTFYLENDLDLAGHEWISIGTGIGGDCPKYAFCGVFDGQGHVISNLYSHESCIEGADESHNLLRNALFGNVYNGEVKNLGVKDAEIWIDPKDDSAAGKGILVDWLGKSKITDCWTSGSIYSGTRIEKNIGGIVGVTVQGCTISGCYSTATLTGNFTNSENYYENPNDLPFDTIGGIVGARFDGSLTVTDCWFDGKIEVNSIQAAVGGIIGYTDDVLGSATVKNCLIATSDMGTDKDRNTCWVAYALGGTIENSYWPKDEGKAYNPSPLASVGGANNQEQGTAVSDFASEDVLTGLQTNASQGITWVVGVKHPTFGWDVYNIPADYAAVDAALTKVNDLNKSEYKNFSAVEDAVKAVNRTKSKAQQEEVDAMAKAIEDAIAALEKKPASSGGSYVPVQKPEIITGEGGKTDLTDHGSTLVITPDTGMQIEKVLLNGKEVKVFDHKVKGLKTGDKVEVTFSRIPPTKAQIDKAIKTSAGNLKLTVRTSKTPKKNIKAVVKQDAALKSLLQEVKEAGYTVKYKFYRSESKKSGYAARLTKTTGVYLNTEGQANAKYYYKAKLQILDREGKTIAETSLKQCRFGVRIWTKGQK